ncbi:MAG: hypothetical protein HC915_13980 [Anaerolineae bacterium]|nr:hypothetical protein [Anaerolineae bacterium]
MNAQVEPMASMTSREVAPHMVIDWLSEGRIVRYSMGSIAFADIEKMYAAVIEIMDRWPSEKLYLALYRTTNDQIIFTPHGRKRLGELADHRPELKGRSAGVVGGQAATHFIRMFMLARRNKGGRLKKYFASEEQAMSWLLEAYPAKDE